MSFAEKVHNRLLALEKQVVALNERLKALEAPPVMTVSSWEVPVVSLPMQVKQSPTVDLVSDRDGHSEPIKRKPGRPKKVVNG